MTSQTSRIAVLTDIADAHLPFVQKHLDQEMIILDPQAVLKRQGLTFGFAPGRNIAVYGEHQLKQIKSIWYRKPRDFTLTSAPVDPELQDYACVALQYHTMQILTACRQARWVSDYYALRRANNKALQLEVAAQLGLRVPETIMTSDPAAAHAFLTTHDKCIVKTYSAYSMTAKSALYTTKVNKKKLPELQNLHLAPAIFQQQIDPQFDVRVTVVGKKAFAASICHKGSETSNILDWRLGHYDGDLRIEPFDDFPADVAKLCVQHVEALGLSFGAIDFVMDKKNRLWFLENNPNGQWGFVERYAGLPIGKAMAELLSAAAK